MCLQNQNRSLLEGNDEGSVIAAIQNDGLAVYLAFSQMLLRARTRKAVMNSRRVLDSASAFFCTMLMADDPSLSCLVQVRHS